MIHAIERAVRALLRLGVPIARTTRIRNGDGPTDGDAIPVALARAGVDGVDASSRVVTARVVVVVADMVARRGVPNASCGDAANDHSFNSN